jgi:hypothetical protein
MQLAVNEVIKKTETKTPQSMWRMSRQVFEIELELIKQPEQEYRSWCG